MQDYTEDIRDSFRNLNDRIKSLQEKLKASRNTFSQHSLVDEITRLEQEKLAFDNVFTDTDAESSPNEAPAAAEFPILSRIWSRYKDLVRKNQSQGRDVQSLLVYMHYFDDEFLGLMNERKLKLDVKFSVERDSFYNRFSELERHMKNFLEESERIQNGDYSKRYEADILKRMVEMRHTLFVEADRFFRRVLEFSGQLLDDLEGETILCQNGDDVLSYTDIDRESELPGLTVQAALQRLYDFSDEVVLYLDIPNFQR